jgi:hypothetical protein
MDDAEGVRRVAAPDGVEITKVDVRGQAELARFVEQLWAHNLEGQVWVEEGRKEEG